MEDKVFFVKHRFTISGKHRQFLEPNVLDLCQMKTNQANIHSMGDCKKYMLFRGTVQLSALIVWKGAQAIIYM